ncbi:unnamed protein product [Plutella xylostella]|uniref:(diamondback moth) hypothetical protein n=1 Tax=Plutella xylostella TaxID=51655 RepID=A0A8S4G1I1_PLUXY|nr:unnamed protein product [Plutella xylostella]
MASSDPEIKDGFTLPAWMKAKPTKEYELFATSPPSPEDSFFFIKYPKSDEIFGKSTLQQDLKNFREGSSDAAAATAADPGRKDWSRHTKPCQEVLHGIAADGGSAAAPVKPLKPKGTDDGFKGEGAACGNSVVKVAHQMISSSGRTASSRGFTVASPSDDASDLDLEAAQSYHRARRGSKSLPVTPKHSPPVLALLDVEAAQSYHRARRGSKNLPVTPKHSPPGSPNSRRKKNVNRYFTSPFEQVEDAGGRSWLTLALLGYKKDLAASSSTLAEEDAIEARLQGASLAESVENLGPSPRGREPRILEDPSAKPPSTNKPKPGYRPKPSELREMNFWSPTSM